MHGKLKNAWVRYFGTNRVALDAGRAKECSAGQAIGGFPSLSSVDYYHHDHTQRIVETEPILSNRGDSLETVSDFETRTGLYLDGNLAKHSPKS
jgi:hypothetical protein